MDLRNCYQDREWEIFFDERTPLRECGRDFGGTLLPDLGQRKDPDWRVANERLYIGTDKILFFGRHAFGEYEVSLDASFSSAELGFWRTMSKDPVALYGLPVGMNLSFSKDGDISFSYYSYILIGDYDPASEDYFTPIGQDLEDFKKRLEENVDSFLVSPRLKFKKIQKRDDIRVNVVTVADLDGNPYGSGGRAVVGVYVDGSLLCDLFITRIGPGTLSLESGCYKSIKFRWSNSRFSSVKEGRWW